jgi:hypothetical protein
MKEWHGMVGILSRDKMFSLPAISSAKGKVTSKTNKQNKTKQNKPRIYTAISNEINLIHKNVFLLNIYPSCKPFA